jgi:DNA-directed RNA polymerase specialized sigma24 family protein
MDLEEIVQHCREQTERFFDEHESDNCYCQELFRRAVKLNNDYAWWALFRNYRWLMRRWLRQCSGLDFLPHSLEELEMRAFEKFWYATHRHHAFDGAAGVQALLYYLRRCCTSVVIDATRKRRRQPYLTSLDEKGYEPVSQHRVEQEVADRDLQHGMWQTVQRYLKGRDEVLVLYYSFVLGLKPRQIQEQYNETFPDVQDIYRIKRNVITRLRNTRILREYWESL